jgi:hypothetical protein
MDAHAPDRKARIADARAETARHLEKALRHSPDLQKPAQIEFYRAHIAYLDHLAAGVACERAKAPTREQWDLTQAVIDARARG